MRHLLPNRYGATGNGLTRILLLLRVPGEVPETALHTDGAWLQHLLQIVSCGVGLAPCPSVLSCLLISPPQC